MNLKGQARLLAFRLLALLDKLRPSDGLPIALYHQVTSTPTQYRIGGHVSPQVFRQQMHRLAKQGYRGISIQEYLALRRAGSPCPPRALGITFDDGQQDVYTSAFPIMRDLGFTATIFMITDYIGREKWFDPDTYKWSDHQPHPQALFFRFMDWGQIEEMRTAGFEFGAHTRTHPSLPSLSVEKAREEIKGSKETLEQAFGEPIRAFGYPFGDFDEKTRQLVVDAGFEAACSAIHKLNKPDTDLFALRRHGIAPIIGPAFDVYLTNKYAWYYGHSRSRRGKE